MSAVPTTFRPLARMGWGGRAASHFRGVIAVDSPSKSNDVEDPQILGIFYYGQVGSVIHRAVGKAANLVLTGITRDFAGVALGGCTVELFQSGGAILTGRVTSDGAGVYAFFNPGSGPFFIRAYKDGAPDLAGVSGRSLTAV